MGTTKYCPLRLRRTGGRCAIRTAAARGTLRGLRSGDEVDAGFLRHSVEAAGAGAVAKSVGGIAHEAAGSVGDHRASWILAEIGVRSHGMVARSAVCAGGGSGDFHG